MIRTFKPDKDDPKHKHRVSRTIIMYTKSTGKKMKNKIIQTIVKTSTGTMLTAFPNGQHCAGPK